VTGVTQEHVRGRATMRDVAAVARVSLKTVSRVVNEEAGVSPILAERVREAVGLLDYRHNLAASNLRRGGQRTRSIGVLVQDIANSFSASFLRAVEDRTGERGVAVLTASIDEEPERERALVDNLVARRVDGLVLMPATADQSYLQTEVRAGLCVVVVDRPAGGLRADSVLVDNLAGARTGVRHLLSRGHRRIACLADLPGIHTAGARLDGFRTALAEADVIVAPALVRTGLRDDEAARLAVHDLLALPEPPTAVFAARNVLSAGAARALQEAGRSYDVALVGFDDFPLADLLTPALTVIRQDVARIGATAADLLLTRLDAAMLGTHHPARNITLATTLVPRGSGEIPPPT